jgi:hypothetical protein
VTEELAAHASRFRPSFMTVTVSLALLATPSFGLLAQKLHDEQAAAASVAADLDERVRSELLSEGFRAHSARTDGEVELLSAERSVRLALAGGVVRCGPPAPLLLERATRVVRAELERYPREFLVATRLRRVLLCEQLHEGELRVPSLPNYEQSLLLDTDASDAFLRRLIHHEVFHFADFADDGELARDPGWARLNDRWFVYGSGGRFVRDGEASHFAENLAGFVSRYATSALEEDKAELFSFMMTEPGRLSELALRDAIVAAKLAALEQQVVKLCPALRPGFWRA